MVNRTKAPQSKLSDELPLIEPQAIRLDNGLPVYLLEGGTEDIVKVEMVFFAGSFFQLEPLLAFCAGKLLQSGTPGKSRSSINELFDFYSAHLQVDVQKDIVSVSMFVLGKHFAPAFKLFAEIIRQPVFPEEEMRVLLRNQQQKHLVNQKKVQHLAMSYFNEMIYGEAHPYGYRTRTEDFEKPAREDVAGFHRDWYQPGNAFCIISGRIPPNINHIMKAHFGDDVWKDNAFDTLKPPVYKMLSSGRRQMHVTMPGAVQSAIRVGKQLLNRTHPAYHQLKITNALLGGFFGSRLMQNIRQDKGYTYGIGSGLVSLVRSGYFFISTQVGLDVRQAALDEIYAELKALRTQPAGKQELEMLRNYLSGNYLRQFDGPFAQAARYKELLVFGLDMSHHQDFLRALKDITSDDIMETAARYLREEEMMEVVVG